ncbi:MAG TPA: hypothetical protein VGI93_18950 [Steroidobacteraceae bacterium]|jgi:uncharacterized protein involved in exopolysaccharide biosynthesis
MENVLPAPLTLDLRTKLLGYWGRRHVFFWAAGIAFVLSALLAIFLPPSYRSTGTILIEQQEIPQELVRSVITSFADQRVQIISQRVMTTQNLLSLIDRYKLYPDIRAKEPRERLLQKMRDDINMRMISADVIDPRSGRPTQATIAFSVSYRNRSPDLAFKVANDLTTLYLNENLTSRTALVQQTSSFFAEEAQREADKIAVFDKGLAAFKAKHEHELPDLMQLNIQSMQRTELELHESENRVAAYDSQKVLLLAQLAQISPNTQVFNDSGQRVFSTEDRLKTLKSQLASYKAKYAPGHPDIIATQREVDGLEKEVASTDATGDRIRQLDEAQGRLAAAKEKYSDDHPDVIRLKHLVDTLQAQVDKDAAAGLKKTETAHADNPVYVQVKGQLDALAVDRDSEIKKRDELQQRYNDYERRLAQSPQVEREYRELARNLESAQLKYQEILSKQTEAQVSQNLETERKGEKFTLIEPPQPPEEPVSPDRLLIMILGVVLSIAAGIGALMTSERLDASIRSPLDIQQMFNVPALASIPLIVTPAEQSRRGRSKLYLWLIGAGALVLVLLAVHFFVRPLDVLVISMLRRFGA